MAAKKLSILICYFVSAFLFFNFLFAKEGKLYNNIIMDISVNDKIKDYHCPRYEELPAEPVYMDNLITILDEYFEPFSVLEEKIITSTMVNNYVKHKVIPAPVNKKYNKKHFVYLISLGILKTVLSIGDVAEVIKKQGDEYPIDVAYNFFATEVENALRVTFGPRDFFHANIASKKTALSELVHSACLSFANKVYVKANIR